MSFIIRPLTECSCDNCKDMCRRCPCFPTPDDVVRLIQAGYMDKLIITFHPDEKSNDYPIPLVAPKEKEKGGCVFHNKEGLCDLHESGLKPTEGKMAIHNLADNGLRRSIIYTWITPKGVEVMRHFNKDGLIATHIEAILPYVQKLK